MLDAFEGRLQKDLPHFALAESLREDPAPDLRVIISDGQMIYFSLAATDKQPKLFGGIPLARLEGIAPAWDGQIHALRFRGVRDNVISSDAPQLLGPIRLELVTPDIGGPSTAPSRHSMLSPS